MRGVEFGPQAEGHPVLCPPHRVDKTELAKTVTRPIFWRSRPGRGAS